VSFAAHNGFVDVDVTVSDFQVEAAFGIGANPCFVVDISSLTAEIGKGHQVTGITFLTSGKNGFFQGASSSQPNLTLLQTESSIHQVLPFDKVFSVVAGNDAGNITGCMDKILVFGRSS
jgi:hypothetical protein